MIWRPTWGSSRPHWKDEWRARYHSITCKARRKQECRNETCKWSPGDHPTKSRRAGYEDETSITMHWCKIEPKGDIVKRTQRTNCSPLWCGRHRKRNRRCGRTVNDHYGNTSEHFDEDNACNKVCSEWNDNALIRTIRTTSNSFDVFWS